MLETYSFPHFYCLEDTHNSILYNHQKSNKILFTASSWHKLQVTQIRYELTLKVLYFDQLSEMNFSPTCLNTNLTLANFFQVEFRNISQIRQVLQRLVIYMP